MISGISNIFGLIYDLIVCLFAPRAFLDSLATRPRNWGGSWGVASLYVITSLIVPVLLIARAGQSISLLELLSFAVFALLFPFATVVGLIALGRNLGGQPDLGRGAALYSLAPLVIANVIFAYILAGPADSYWFERGDHLALLYPIGTQNALISFPNWES